MGKAYGPAPFTQDQSHAAFWAKVQKTDGCWFWKGRLESSGYGQVNRRGKLTGAHRFSWEIVYGEIPDGLWVLHRCDVRSCVNPDHLFLGTQRDNMRDMHAKGRGDVYGHKHRIERAADEWREQMAG